MLTDPSPAATDEPAGRVERFVALLARHQTRVQRFVCTLVPAPADADDILQATNLFLWREFHRYRPGSDLVAWACAVAFQEVRAWRTRRKRDRLVFSDEFLTAVRDELERTDEVADRRAAALAGCLDKLPPPHRELIRLRYADGGGVPDIAAVGRSPAAVYRMLSRVRQALHQCVTQTLAREGRP